MGATSPSTCVPCVAGQYAPEGSTSCIPCAQDTYSLQSATSCTACPAGTGVKSTGAPECCYAGYYYSVSQRKCVECPYDYYNGTPGLLSCTACPGIYAGNAYMKSDMETFPEPTITCTVNKASTDQSKCSKSNCPTSGGIILPNILPHSISDFYTYCVAGYSHYTCSVSIKQSDLPTFT